MSNTVIQQSLIDIEQNLRKLESARSQVGTFAGKSEELIALVTELVSSIETLKKNYEEAESKVQKDLEKSQVEFEKSLAKTLNAADSKSKEFLSNQELFAQKAIENLKEFETKLIDTKKSIEELDLEKGLNDVKLELSGIREQLISQSNTLNSVLGEIHTSLDIRLLEIQKSNKNILIAVGIATFIISMLVLLLK